MNKLNKTIRGSIVIIVVVGLLLWVLPMFKYYPDATVDDMRSLIQSELLANTNSVEVIEFLDKRNIEHSDLKEGERIIYAIIREACVSFLLECSIDMKFHFDEKGNLASYSVEEGLTGL